MRTSTILLASLLVMTSPIAAQTASARSLAAGVGVTAAPRVLDTGSQKYPSSPSGASESRTAVTGEPPQLDIGSEQYPSSATGAGERANPVVAGGAIVNLAGSESMPESASSLPPDFTNPYLAHR